jgi:hypothetical protein
MSSLAGGNGRCGENRTPVKGLRALCYATQLHTQESCGSESNTHCLHGDWFTASFRDHPDSAG